MSSTYFDQFRHTRTGTDLFRAATSPRGRRVHGGYMLAQALLAAAATVTPDRTMHSMQASFLRSGESGVDLDLHVERVRDGRTFSTRRVTVAQAGRLAVTAQFSFHTGGSSADWQPPAPECFAPDAAPAQPTVAGVPEFKQFFDIRAGSARLLEDPTRYHPYWARHVAPLPDDPLLHACALVRMSDVAVTASMHPAGAERRIRLETMSLDHLLWLHRPFRVDDWLLFSVEPENNFAGRGLGRGTIHDAAGRLVATLMQEGFIGR